MVFYGTQNFLEVLAKVKADEHECGDPHHCARVCEEGEAAVFDFRRSGDDCREVTDAGDKVANHERPVADLIEPRMHTLNVLLLDVQKLSHTRM